MGKYTIGGLRRALKPGGMVFVWQRNAYSIYNDDGSPVWYDTPLRLNKTDFIAKLAVTSDDAPCMPYYVTNHEWQYGSHKAIARNVYVGIVPTGRPNVVQDGDE